MIRHEDVVMTYCLFNTANSYKFIGKYGIYHIHRDDNASNRRVEIEMNVYNLYLTDVVIDFAKERKENQDLVANLMIVMLNRKELEKSLDLNKDNKNILISCLDRVLQSNFISSSHKNEIIKKVKNLKFLNYTAINI